MCDYEDHVGTWGKAHDSIKLEQSTGTLRGPRSCLSSSPFLILLCPAPYFPGPTPDFLSPMSGDIWQDLDSGRNLWERGGQRKGEARALLSPLPFCLP